ncbi:2-isopropylmalate synthase [Streptosporangium pseudovulgare]|uniref:2-isopropylmalate synthase n=1 Tax=Streptosporangium pseudovulgare TaxID=35765 RepID=A0ABQ2RA07_9ACTN|nr:2-isopropylmalate synthase [Streptosporangium pseudovulgare]GGQ18414.1 2-isopropylmalate synthase [Streptosporangium pseudovulgare]
MNTGRYTAFPQVPLNDRTWPDATVTAAPRWLSTDLRDGNQALAAPMTPARKLVMFDLLVRMGYKEIEIGFPAASRDDHDFVRMLIEDDLIPDDVRVSVLVQAREELIERTVESLAGARRATVHLYSATSPWFRRRVFGMDRDECKDLAVRGTRLVTKYAERFLDGCDLGFQYSPEHFADTEPDFTLEVCEAVMDVWQPGPGREIILNFPTTVERSTPNVFADQIEWMHRNLSRREHLCLSVHPHNDRGTGVAAAELAVLAGAQRIEGCLFGNGERAGNVCLVTLGLNLLTQGVDPRVDFRDLDRVRRTVERCTGIPVHPRHPYGGDLVYTAFSGSHQDAINKGFDALEREAAEAGAEPAELPWRLPYLPLDPQDVGRTYEAIVRINSQSGKGGLAYVMSARHGLNPPRALRVEFARTVQALADAEGGEIGPDRLRECFEREYVIGAAPDPSAPSAETVATVFGGVPAAVVLHVDGGGFDAGGDRTDAVRTVRAELARRGLRVRAVHHTGPAGDGRTARREARPLPGGGRAGEPREDTDGGGLHGLREVAVYAELQAGGTVFWGAGIGPDLRAAALSAAASAVARSRRERARRTAAPTTPAASAEAAPTAVPTAGVATGAAAEPGTLTWTRNTRTRSARARSTRTTAGR